MRELVVCAANKHKESGFIICGARHWDEIMHGVMKEMGREDYHLFDQGFITNKRRWITRQEAFTMAQQNNQIRNTDGMPMSGDLFSEHLY